jgi:hypothetical protein
MPTQVYAYFIRVEKSFLLFTDPCVLIYFQCAQESLNRMFIRRGVTTDRVFKLQSQCVSCRGAIAAPEAGFLYCTATATTTVRRPGINNILMVRIAWLSSPSKETRGAFRNT